MSIASPSSKAFPLILIGAMVAAGTFAAFHRESPVEPEAASQATRQPREEIEEEPAAPPIDPHAISPHGKSPVESAPAPSVAANHEDDAVTWKVPSAWRTLPNPNTMRLATYRAPTDAGAEEAEMSVARAGGSVDDNIDRWVGQFEPGAKQTRTVKKVRGLKVTIVELGGTYLAGAGMGGTPASHAGWSLLAAIVETSGSPYFFKLTGPVASVRAAHPAFDALVESVTPTSKAL